jgi:hypothetical protein
MPNSYAVEMFDPAGCRADRRDDGLSNPTINVEGLTKVLDHVETLAAFEHEGVRTDRWRQGFWGQSDYRHYADPEICGTAACFAGWTLLDHGYTIKGWRFRAPNGMFVTPELHAAELLGLTDYESSVLFAGNNDLDDLRQVVARLVDCAEREQEAAQG